MHTAKKYLYGLYSRRNLLWTTIRKLSFRELNLEGNIVRNLKRYGIKEATDIQAKVKSFLFIPFSLCYYFYYFRKTYKIYSCSMYFFELKKL